MPIFKIAVVCLAVAGLSLFSFAADAAVAGDKTPVLLSFDVEKPGDGAALASLRLEVPATYFLTGTFAGNNADLVAELARKNTVGAHSYAHANLTTLTADALRLDLGMNRMLLERATGQAPTWFRAPYGEHNDDVMAAAMEVGFLYDSSDWGRWQRQRRLRELPVSMGADGLVASDYGLVFERKMSDSQLLSWFQRSYREKAATGRPFVILLHPSIIAPHAEVLRDFVAFVEAEQGVFLSFDQYLEAVYAPRPERFGTWIDWSLEGYGWGRHDPEQIADDVAAAGLTDVFLMVWDPEGERYDLPGEDRFGRTLELLKQRGLRVHAWTPLFLEVTTAREHPEWAMAAQDGTRSEQWLSPHHPEVRARILAKVAGVLERYTVDGVHLDYIRFPGLDHDYSPLALAGFARDQGIELEGSLLEEVQGSRYEAWTDWRARQIAGMAQEVRDLVRSTAPGIPVSAAVVAEAAISYRDWEKFGQDYTRLGRQLDFIVPMAYHKLNQRTPGWIADVLLGARHKVGRTPVWLGVDTFRNPGRGPGHRQDYTLAELEEVLRVALAGADGVAAYPYLHLFGRGNEAWNMPAGAQELFAEAAAGRLAPVAAGEQDDLWRDFRKQPLKALILAVPLLLAAAFAVRRSPLWRHRSLSPGGTEADAWPVLAQSWRELDSALRTGLGPTGVRRRVTNLLRALGSTRLQRFRRAFMLESIVASNSALDALLVGLDTVPGWRTLGLRYLQEAALLGLVELGEGRATLTAAGREELERARAEGYQLDLWRFVEARLHEALIVSCPGCGTRNSLHWFWHEHECERCGRQLEIGECAEIGMQTAVSVLSYHAA